MVKGSFPKEEGRGKRGWRIREKKGRGGENEFPRPLRGGG